MKTRFATALALLGMAAASAATVPVAFTPLTGLTGGSPAETAVFRADLSGVGIATLLSLTIRDNSGGIGGATGQFSGFDLDAVKLSYTLAGDATTAAGLAGLSVFDFTAGSIFTPGTQRPPANPKLFGTGPTGATVDNAVATLGAFDANSSTAIPPAFGFLSMGDNGILTLNLTAGVSTAGLYLYIGEVGDNGEVAAGTISVSDTRVTSAPEGGMTLGMLGLALAGLAWCRRKSDGKP